jgi:CelD/BcsL family acetyltransferase involved in cellulose biosynthesis
MSRLQVDVVEGMDGLASIGAEWDALFDSVANASPFLSHAWMTSWQATLGTGSQPWVLCARDGRRLVGLLALSRRAIATGMGTAHRLSLLGEPIVAADGLDLLAPPGCARPAAAAILTRLGAEPFDLLVLDGLPADSPMLQPIAWQLGNDARRSYTLSTHQVCPYLDLRPGWDAVLAASRRPNQIGRLHKDLAGMPGFELRTVTEAELVGGAFDRLLQLHDRRWAIQGGSDALSQPAVRAFHRRLLPSLARRGMVRFEELWVEGGCRATYYGFGQGDHYRLYQTGYDPDWARKSVAFVRMASSIREAAERGVTHYELLRGTETYKFDWAAAARVTLSLQVVAARPAAQLLARAQQLRVATEVAAEAVFPRRALDVLRRWRRARQKRTPYPSPPPRGGREIQGREIQGPLMEVGRG